MLDYQTTVQDFDLNTVASQYLSGSMQAVNACYECCDRHANSDAIALYWHGKDGRKEQYSFAELKKYSSQFANSIGDFSDKSWIIKERPWYIQMAEENKTVMTEPYEDAATKLQVVTVATPVYKPGTQEIIGAIGIDFNLKGL